MCMYMHVCLCVCLNAPVDGRDWHGVASSGVPCFILLRQGLFLNLELVLIWLVWLTNFLQEFCVSSTVLVRFYCQLSTVQSLLEMRELQLNNQLHQIGLWACLEYMS